MPSGDSNGDVHLRLPSFSMFIVNVSPNCWHPCGAELSRAVRPWHLSGRCLVPVTPGTGSRAGQSVELIQHSRTCFSKNVFFLAFLIFEQALWFNAVKQNLRALELRAAAGAPGWPGLRSQSLPHGDFSGSELACSAPSAPSGPIKRPQTCPAQGGQAERAPSPQEGDGISLGGRRFGAAGSGTCAGLGVRGGWGRGVLRSIAGCRAGSLSCAGSLQALFACAGCVCPPPSPGLAPGGSCAWAQCPCGGTRSPAREKPRRAARLSPARGRAPSVPNGLVPSSAARSFRNSPPRAGSHLRSSALRTGRR